CSALLFPINTAEISLPSDHNAYPASAYSRTTESPSLVSRIDDFHTASVIDGLVIIASPRREARHIQSLARGAETKAWIFEQSEDADGNDDNQKAESEEEDHIESLKWSLYSEAGAEHVERILQRLHARRKWLHTGLYQWRQEHCDKGVKNVTETHLQRQCTAQ
ncbi:hypothetical protein CERZMDRAFT_90654, partial [Cercospora zeae-maydis SCOH1-5]